MKTYHKPVPLTLPTHEVPKLHTVFIGPDRIVTPTGVVKNWDYRELHNWCIANCKDKFYSHWNGNWQFDDDEDAMLFALRWK